MRKRVDTMTKKMTKKEMFAHIMASYALTDEEKAFIQHEIELLEKKNTRRDGSKAMTATQKANEVLKARIVEILSKAEKPMSVSEIAKSDSELAELSGQKVSAIITLLKNDGIVKRVEIKRKAYFKLIDSSEEEEE